MRQVWRHPIDYQGGGEEEVAEEEAGQGYLAKTTYERICFYFSLFSFLYILALAFLHCLCFILLCIFVSQRFARGTHDLATFIEIDLSSNHLWNNISLKWQTVNWRSLPYLLILIMVTGTCSQIASAIGLSGKALTSLMVSSEESLSRPQTSLTIVANPHSQ